MSGLDFILQSIVENLPVNHKYEVLKLLLHASARTQRERERERERERDLAAKRSTANK